MAHRLTETQFWGHIRWALLFNCPSVQCVHLVRNGQEFSLASSRQLWQRLVLLLAEWDGS